MKSGGKRSVRGRYPRCFGSARLATCVDKFHRRNNATIPSTAIAWATFMHTLPVFIHTSPSHVSMHHAGNSITMFARDTNTNNARVSQHLLHHLHHQSRRSRTSTSLRRVLCVIYIFRYPTYIHTHIIHRRTSGYPHRHTGDHTTVRGTTQASRSLHTSPQCRRTVLHQDTYSRFMMFPEHQ